MTLLVADVGGTNTRIALRRSGAMAGMSDIARYENVAFPSFYEVLSRYGADRDMTGLTGCCIAVAGPVTSRRARLTNRDWDFDPATIGAALPFGNAGQVHLVNDLVALGYALPDLTPDQVLQIRPAQGNAPSNNQALVAGMGTGFNICLVKDSPGTPVVIEAELGHASLPASVSTQLDAALGERAAQFATVEDLFSGRGLSRLYRTLSGGVDKTGPQILSGYGGSECGHATQAADLSARLLGVFARELVFQYLPFGGIHFAGGAARGILGSPLKQVFLQSFAAPGPFADHLAQVPVRLITDDTAALTGAARFAQAQAGNR